MMFQNKPKHHYADLLEGILIGGSLVGMATFLFGTKKGKRLQKDLMHQYKKLKHKAEDLRHQIEKKVHKAAPKLKRAAKAFRAKTRKTVRKSRRKKRS